VPWEQILEFRAHSGASEARARLREFERLALAEGPEDAATYLLRVGQEVNRAYLATIEELRPRMTDEIGRQLAAGAVGLVPLVGPGLSAGMGLADSAVERTRFARSWTAALMKLTK